MWSESSCPLPASCAPTMFRAGSAARIGSNPVTLCLSPCSMYCSGVIRIWAILMTSHAFFMGWWVYRSPCLWVNNLPLFLMLARVLSSRPGSFLNSGMPRRFFIARAPPSFSISLSTSASAFPESISVQPHQPIQFLCGYAPLLRHLIGLLLLGYQAV